MHAVSRFLLEHGSDIIDNHQFGDRRDGHFFMRVHFATSGSEAAIGRDAEPAALARAVRWHCEGRVFVQGRRTVVLR